MNPLEFLGFSGSSDVLQGITGLIDTGINIYAADQAARNAKWQKDLAYKNYAMQYENYQKQWDYTYNAKQYQVADLEKAGLSKALANGSPVTPSSAQAPQYNTQGVSEAMRQQMETLQKLNLSEKVAMIRQANAQVSRTNAESKVLHESALRERAQRFNIQADTRDKNYNYEAWSRRKVPFGEYQSTLPRNIEYLVREIAEITGSDFHTLSGLIGFLFKRSRGPRLSQKQQYELLEEAARELSLGYSGSLPAD